MAARHSELAEQGRRIIAWQVVRMMAAAVAAVTVLALLDPGNSVPVTLAFYGTLGAGIGGIAWLLHRGRTRLSGWLLASVFYFATFGGTVMIGGLENNAGASYIVSVMIAAVTLGRRPAVAFAVASIIGVSVVGYAHQQRLLPTPMAPVDSAVNAWLSLVVPLAVSAYLLHLWLQQMQQLLQAAADRERERDEAQAGLLQSQKLEAVGRLVAGIAHDFNNLLTVIIGSTELLKGDERPDPAILEGVRDAADRAALMTNRLLAFGRPQAARPRPLDLQRALGDLAPLLQRLVGDEVRVELLPVPEVSVEIDPVAFEQIVLNLVINAKEAIDGSGRVTVAVDADPKARQATLSVADTGPGVSSAVIDKLFQPFFTTKDTGTGLGLSTVRSLVEAAKGRIQVRNTESGARFEVRLPLFGDVQVPSTRPTRPSRDTAGLKVLLVDDDELVLAASAGGLRANGFEVVAARDGLEALSILEKQRFDAVITDNAMHGMTGLELARRVVVAQPELPILLVSGNPVDAALPPGVAYLGKPYAHSVLIETVGELVHGRASAAQNA